MIRLEPALVVALAAIGGAIATTANAADLPTLPPAPVPVAVEAFGGWYLRGDIGMSSQQSDEPENPRLDAAFPPQQLEWIHSGFDSAPFVGIGAGYRFNSWLRADITGEYRGTSRYNGLDRYFDGGWRTNEFYAEKSEWVGLVNGYLDLGTWYGVTPFVGAGVGFARVTIDGFRDVDVTRPALTRAGEKSTTNFAWALYAGLGYEVSPNLTLELGYRYLALGAGETGETTPFNGPSGLTTGWEFENLHLNDLKVGMHLNLQAPAAVYAAPISRSF
ncbi:MAG: outer membrane protein [Salinarimonas sp.]